MGIICPQIRQLKALELDNRKSCQAESRLSNKILIHFRYSCFETDPVWGYLSSAFIFISGIAWSFMIAYNLQRKTCLKKIHFWIIVLLAPVSSLMEFLTCGFKISLILSNKMNGLQENCCIL